MLLGRLAYGVGPFDGILDDHTKRALREYEKKRGLPETGDPMSYQTFVQVGEDRESLDREPVRLPTLFIFVDHWDMRDSLDAA